MPSRNKVKGFWKSPGGIALAVIALVAMILAIVVFSTNKEAQIKEGKQPKVDPKARPSDSQEETIISPPSEEEVIITEDGNLPTEMKSNGVYRNDRVLSASTGYGMTLSVGLEQDGVTDALYLNPHFEYAYAGNPNEAYGYLMRAERVPLEYAEPSPSPAWSTKYDGITDFAILGRTYDKVVSVSARDSVNYGVRWMDSPAYGGMDNAGDTVHILIIRLSDGTLMGAVNICVSFDRGTKTYSLENLTNNDVGNTGDLSAEQRDNLIAETVQYLTEGNDQMTLSVTKEELESQSRSTVIEKIPRVYYNKLYDTNGNVVAAGRFSKCDIYAVNINCDGYGFFTVYFAPEPQANGLAAPTLAEGDELKLVPIGYDAFAPFTIETFNSFLFPEDISLFDAANF